MTATRKPIILSDILTLALGAIVSAAIGVACPPPFGPGMLAVGVASSCLAMASAAVHARARARRIDRENRDPIA